MKRSDIFLQAARLIESGESDKGCCRAMRAVLSLNTDELGMEAWISQHARFLDAYNFLAALFRNRRTYWWPLSDRDSRVIALCMAAAIARDEEDGK